MMILSKVNSILIIVDEKARKSILLYCQHILFLHQPNNSYHNIPIKRYLFYLQRMKKTIFIIGYDLVQEN